MNDTAADPIAKELAFPATEYGERLAKVRARMSEAELDLLIVHNIASICYLTGYQTPLADWYHCLLVPRDGALVLQVCDTELAAMHTTVETLLPVDWERMDEAAGQLVDLLRARGAERARIGVEMRRPGLNPYTERYLRSELSNADWVDASALVLGVRAVKSPAEVSHLREAARFSVRGMEAAVASLTSGVTDNAICAGAMAAMVGAGSEYFSIDPIVRSGRRSGVTHATCKRHAIGRGDPVLIELGGVYQRYCAPLLRTAVMGPPSRELRTLADASLRVMDRLFDHLTPGRRMDDVARAAAGSLVGLDPGIKMRGYFGYSVGISFPPSWVERSVEIALGSEEILEPGMVFHAHRSMRVSGRMGVGFSETVLVTQTGCEFLTEFPRELIICR